MYKFISLSAHINSETKLGNVVANSNSNSNKCNLGLSSLMLRTTLSHRKMALTEFASHDYLEIAKGASAYIAYESSSLMKAVKSFIYSKENTEDKISDLEDKFYEFNDEINNFSSSKLELFLDGYIKQSTFINKFNLKAETEFQEDLDLRHSFNLARSDFRDKELR